MDELENLKTMWQALSDRVAVLETENRNLARKVTNDKFRSARERLIRKYNAFIIVELIMIVYIFTFIWANPMMDEKYRLITAIYWLAFFLFEIAIDCYLKQGVKKIDIYNSSVREIATQAAKNWKIHKIAISISLPFAIGACILFALAINANEFIILGMITGGLAGLLIGIVQLKKFFQYYRLLQSSEE